MTAIRLATADANTVAGNFIGTDITGQIGAVGNVTQGILIDQSANNVIGGTLPADRNVISGNRLRGIAIDDWSDGAAITSGGTQIIGNFIGTTADGLAALPYDGVPNYQQIGIYLLNASGTTIGTATVGNVLSGNHWYGVYNWGPDGGGNTIQGNIVGLDALGTSPVGNGADDPATRSGLYMSNSPDNLIGGAAAGEGNTIAGNDGKGVIVQGTSALDNTILGNTFHTNVGLGIELGLDEVTPNDPGDLDAGPNDLLNFPEITNVQRVAGDLVVDLTLDVPAGDYRLELFGNGAAHPSGYGEGETLLGGSTITHTGSGSETFTVTVTSGPTILSATTTEDLGGSYGATSEFSLAVPSPDLVIVNSTAAGADASTGDGQCDTGGTNSAGDPECTLRAAIEEANDPTTPVDTIWFAMPATEAGHASGVWTISPATALPAVTATTTIDGSTQPGHIATTNAAPLPLDGTLVVEIDGGGSVVGDGLWIQGDGSTVRGLAIGGFFGAGSDGIQIDANGVTIAGTYVGTDAIGTADNPSAYGIIVNGTGTTIGGTDPADRNLITGSHNAQIQLNSGPSTSILGNVIGANAATDALVGTIGTGVQAWLGDDAVIGSAAAPNVIAVPAGEWGIDLGSADAAIDANLIGTDNTFTFDLGAGDGIQVGGDRASVTDNVIGNLGTGVAVTGDDAVLIGNAIGTDPTGTIDLGNTAEGIVISGATATVGGTTAGDET